MKKRVFVLSALILFIGLAAITYYYTQHIKLSPLPPSVTTSKGDITAKITAVGSIVPLKTATIKSPISGTVETLFRDEGDYVKKGEPLLKVNPQPTPSDYATKKQNVAMALAREQKDKLDLARYQYLLKQGVISKKYELYQEAQKTYQVDHEQRILDEQLLSLIVQGKAIINGKEIGNTIVSPSNGFVVERDVNVGDPVVSQSDFQAGNALMVVADMNDLVFQGQVSETDTAKLAMDMPASITVAAYPEQQIKGEITKLSLQSTQMTASNTPLNSASNTKSSSPFNVGFNVQIGKLNLPSTIKLRSGYSATAEIVTAKLTQVLMIPERVLQFEKDQNYVWVLNKENKPEKRTIKIGLSDGVNVQVLSGLEEGERVLEVPPDIK
jgi:HlyD family secretion protein